MRIGVQTLRVENQQAVREERIAVRSQGRRQIRLARRRLAHEGMHILAIGHGACVQGQRATLSSQHTQRGSREE